MSLLLQNVVLPLQEFSLELDLEIPAQVTAIFGPSGAGKTSLLDLIAGLRRPTSARIEIDGDILINTARHFHQPTRHRGIGYVPQDLALFPHLSVRQNLLYGVKPGQKIDPAFQFESIVELLEVGTLVNRRIDDLSGGEKQRVALARALLTAPRLLLLDEPLSSLDSRLKEKIIPCLGRIRAELSVPILYVTHDRDEVLALCDEVILLERGKVIGRGEPEDLLVDSVAEAILADAEG